MASKVWYGTILYGIVQYDIVYTPVWKVCILQPRSRARNFDVPYIIYSKFLKSRASNLQALQPGIYRVVWYSIVYGTVSYMVQY